MLKSFSDGNEVSQNFCISIIQKIPYSESLWIEPLWMFEYLASWRLYSPVMPIEFQWHRCRFLRPLPDGPPPSTRSRICQGRQRSWILRQREGQQWWSGDALLANTLVGRGMSGSRRGNNAIYTFVIRIWSDGSSKCSPKHIFLGQTCVTALKIAQKTK